MIIFTAIKLLFSFKSNNKVIALSALSCWMLGLVMLIFVGISEGRSWSIDGTRYGESLELSQQDTLVLLVNERYKLPENLYIDQDVFQHDCPGHQDIFGRGIDPDITCTILHPRRKTGI